MGIRRILGQWATKTLGGSTKLSVDEYHAIQDPVHIQEGNLDVIHLSNAVGQATNTQSQSGPMVGTMAIKTSTSSGSGTFHTIFRPDAGEVWQLIDASFDLDNATGAVNLRLYLSDGTDSVVIDHESESASGEFTTDTIGPILFSYEVYLQGWQQGTFDGVTWKAAVVRVR